MLLCLCLLERRSDSGAYYFWFASANLLFTIARYVKDTFTFFHHLLLLCRQLVARVCNDCVSSGYCKQNKTLQFVCLVSAVVDSPPKDWHELACLKPSKRSWKSTAHMLMADCGLGRIHKRGDCITSRASLPSAALTISCCTLRFTSREGGNSNVLLWYIQSFCITIVDIKIYTTAF